MVNSIQKLIHEFSKLPGIGEKTALRFAFHLLRQQPQYAEDLARAILEVKERVRLCSICCALTDVDPCPICHDPKRDEMLLCVVEDPSDMLAIEKTRVFRGRYHVLHGALSPLEGIGPDDLRIRELLARLERRTMSEVVIATNINLEGEATALYLTRLLRPTGIKLTRLASGVPVGGDLEYIDATTLTRAFEERNEV
ncbi:MAG: recombination protein RecR [Deltaproteobacteria bacterium RIFCSPLOWO2_02_FULL_44_10]|nr:MAG: recombination protein RecR [Deltaproteobacteria bacterium RIFCSPHIGHO2_02_FULL_44_16]OGQ45238.1 MAG: recombination protein RecR [Deltaproteobacteria bacterium RIFCSPLOWO2_02_FULL_44_10]